MHSHAFAAKLLDNKGDEFDSMAEGAYPFGDPLYDMYVQMAKECHDAATALRTLT